MLHAAKLLNNGSYSVQRTFLSPVPKFVVLLSLLLLLLQRLLARSHPLLLATCKCSINL